MHFVLGDTKFGLNKPLVVTPLADPASLMRGSRWCRTTALMLNEMEHQMGFEPMKLGFADRSVWPLRHWCFWWELVELNHLRNHFTYYRNGFTVRREEQLPKQKTRGELPRVSKEKLLRLRLLEVQYYMGGNNNAPEK